MNASLNASAETPPVHPLEAMLGHVFLHKKLLEEALTHKSMHNHAKQGYERLEFLGDRVLGLVVAETLLRRFPQEAEGAIAKRHAALVNRDSLVVVATRLNIASHLCMPRNERASGAAHLPSVQADAMEALLGALYLDAGLSTAQRVIGEHWSTLLEGAVRPPVDAKSALQEWAQSFGYPLPHYTLVERAGPAHAPVFRVEVAVSGLQPTIGEGSTKKLAEQAAAEQALLQCPSPPTEAAES